MKRKSRRLIVHRSSAPCCILHNTSGIKDKKTHEYVMKLDINIDDEFFGVDVSDKYIRDDTYLFIDVLFGIEDDTNYRVRLCFDWYEFD